MNRPLVFLSAFFLIFSGLSSGLYSLQITNYLNLSGFLRTRFWNNYVNTGFPERPAPSSAQEYVNYIDLYYRSHIGIQVMEEMEIHSVFDVFSIFGASSGGTVETIGGGLGMPGVNFVTRNLYGEFKPTDYLNITFGLLPFSLPEGYILAKNGAGIKYDHRIYKELIHLYAFWIKAVENSLTDSNQDGFGDSEKRDDDIYVVGNKMVIKNIVSLETYYVFRYDQSQETDLVDDGRGRFHWLGAHTKVNYSRFFLHLSGIYNFGEIIGVSEKFSRLSAGLWAVYLGYHFKYAELGLRNEGATGRNIKNRQHQSSFRTIAHSRGLSYIFVDDSGGISIRRSGELFAAHVNAVELTVRYFNDIDIKLKYFHHRSIYPVLSNSRGSSTYLGDELNGYAKYNYSDSIYFEITAALFWPKQAYLNWVEINQSEPIVEILLKAQMNY